MFENVNEIIQEYLKKSPGGETYPSGMKRLFNYFSENNWENFWDEAVEFSISGDSDVRNKIRKELEKTTKEKFLKEIKIIYNIANEKMSNKVSILDIYEWYDEIKDLNAFKILDKRIGNGIPNAMLKSMKRNQNVRQFWMLNYYNEDTLEKWKMNNIITLDYETNSGDLNEYQIIDELDEVIGSNDDGAKRTNIRRALWDFSHEMNIGDEVYVMSSSNEVVTKLIIKSEYKYLDEIHVRDVEFINVIKGAINTNFSKKILTNISQYPEFVDEVKVATGEIGLEGYEANECNDNLYSCDDFLYDYSQLIIDGAPGTGKSYYVKNELTCSDDNVLRVTFHQEYEYHNFVGSIMPVVDGDSVKYEFIKGPFATILDEALSNPNGRHVLVIEELTRGNAPAIFGDVFQLLDREDNGFSEYSVRNDSLYNELSKVSRDTLMSIYGKEEIGLPSNLSIICTVNSSDQNVYPLDTAFKRRFKYKIMSTEANDEFKDFKVKLGSQVFSWKQLYTSLNEFFLHNMGLKEDKQLGPYFVKDSDEKSEVATKLAMYLWSDINRVYTSDGEKIFKETVKTLVEVDQAFNSNGKLDSIFSNEFNKFMNDKFSKDTVENNVVVGEGIIREEEQVIVENPNE